MTDALRAPRRRPTFLGKLDQLDDEPQEGDLEAIVRNLSVTLNTKAGYGSLNSVFGLTDIQGYVSSRDALEGVLADMLEQVIRFEPRVELPVLRFLGRDPAPWGRFELSGKVNGRKQRFGIRFHSIFRTVQIHRV